MPSRSPRARFVLDLLLALALLGGASASAQPTPPRLIDGLVATFGWDPGGAPRAGDRLLGHNIYREQPDGSWKAVRYMHRAVRRFEIVGQPGERARIRVQSYGLDAEGSPIGSPLGPPGDLIQFAQVTPGSIWPQVVNLPTEAVDGTPLSAHPDLALLECWINIEPEPEGVAAFTVGIPIDQGSPVTVEIAVPPGATRLRARGACRNLVGTSPPGPERTVDIAPPPGAVPKPPELLEGGTA